jgi:hypothetical protein
LEYGQRRAIYNFTAANFICISKIIKVNISRKEISASIFVGEERFLACRLINQKVRTGNKEKW